MSSTINVYSGQSISAAIDKASSGDSILVHEGTYSENLVIKKQITLSSADAGKTYITDKNNKDSCIRVEDDGSGSTISGFIISGSVHHGIYLDSAKKCTISNNTVQNNKEHGIYNSNGDGSTISNNITCDNDNSGICVEADSCYIQSNTSSSNGHYGIHVDGDNNSVLCNTTNKNDDDHDNIYVEGSDNEIKNNTSQGSGSNGINVEGDGNEVEENIVSDSDNDGIHISNSQNYIMRNQISGSKKVGIYIGDSSNHVDNNSLSDNGQGIKLCGNDNRLDGNTITGHSKNDDYSRGIYIYQCSENYITENDISNNKYGIYIEGLGMHDMWNGNAKENNINNNNFHDNDEAGIYIMNVEAVDLENKTKISFNSFYKNNNEVELNLSCGNIIEHNSFNGGDCVIYEAPESRDNKLKYNTIADSYSFLAALFGNPTVSCHYNRIVKTGTIETYNCNKQGKFHAINNWWGTNNGPSSDDYDDDRTEVNPWIVLTVNTPNPITYGGTTNITAELIYDNKGNDTSSSSEYIPDTNITFSSTNVSLNSAGCNSVTIETNDGSASVTVIADQSNKAGSVTVTLDNESIPIPITIEAN